jgi:hypothetical protein
MQSWADVGAAAAEGEEAEDAALQRYRRLAEALASLYAGETGRRWRLLPTLRPPPGPPDSSPPVPYTHDHDPTLLTRRPPHASSSPKGLSHKQRGPQRLWAAGGVWRSAPCPLGTRSPLSRSLPTPPLAAAHAPSRPRLPLRRRPEGHRPSPPIHPPAQATAPRRPSCAPCWARCCATAWPARPTSWGCWRGARRPSCPSWGPRWRPSWRRSCRSCWRAARRPWLRCVGGEGGRKRGRAWGPVGPTRLQLTGARWVWGWWECWVVARHVRQHATVLYNAAPTVTPTGAATAQGGSAEAEAGPGGAASQGLPSASQLAHDPADEDWRPAYHYLDLLKASDSWRAAADAAEDA